MQKELTCEQVGAIITFYLEGKLSDSLKKAVKKHLDSCPECHAKFEELKQMVNYFEKSINEKNDTSDDIVKSEYQKRQYAEFKYNLSAYLDNELDDKENIRIKKITISNPIARKDLEDMYSFKKILHNSFDITKNELKQDFAKTVINEMHEHKNNTEISFQKLTFAFFAILTLIIIGAIKLWF